MNADYRGFYRGRRVMMTGGLGFIGSNLVHQLVDLGADVMLVDSLHSRLRRQPVQHRRHRGSRAASTSPTSAHGTTMNVLVRERDVIFNLAGQVSHIDSMRDPHTDLEINCRAPAVDARGVPAAQPGGAGRLRRNPPGLRPARSAAGRRVASRAASRHQRHQQGRGRVLPHRSTTTCSASARARCGSRTSTARDSSSGTIARDSSAGSSGWRIEGGEIQIFGDGSQLRDFVLRGRCRRCVPARGRDGRLQRRRLQRRRQRADQPPRSGGAAAGGRPALARVRYVEWPAEKKRIDIGSFYTDSTKFRDDRRLDSRASAA